MKKILALFTAIIIAVSLLSVPASAVKYNGIDYPDSSDIWDRNAFPFAIIVHEGNTPYFMITTKPLSNSDGWLRINDTTTVKYYYLSGSTWVYERDGTWATTPLTKEDNIKWSSYDIEYQNGGVFFAGSEPVNLCDGSTCPANDLDHNNVCDDCGLVLTMSLRSSLWEYAQSVVANGMDIFDSDYWVVTDNGANGYKIYISDSPFQYIASSGNLVSNSVVQRTEVYDTSDGSYIGGTSWASKQPNTALDVGSPVATSHPIEGFFPIPLWMEMDRLTQGEMVTMGQTLGGTMKILVPCGVGLVALLAVLKLFGKRSLIFRS